MAMRISSWDKIIEDVILTDEGALEVVTRTPAEQVHGDRAALLEPESLPDRVQKFIFYAKDGRIQLASKVDARVEPKKTIEEKVSFPDATKE